MINVDFEHFVDWSGRHADSEGRNDRRRLTGEPAESGVSGAEINSHFNKAKRPPDAAAFGGF
jgi:hypothetical protein